MYYGLNRSKATKKCWQIKEKINLGATALFWHWKTPDKKKEITRYRLAQLTNLSNASITNIEELRQNPTLSTLIEMAIAIEFDLPQAVKANFPETFDTPDEIELCRSPIIEKINDTLKNMNEDVLEVAYNQIKALKSLKK